jgi:acetyl-CoA C-acetyltransferase
MVNDLTPVLVGCGQITQREADPLQALDAMALAADAAKLAAEDAGAGALLLQALDTIVVVRSFADTSWRFTSPFGGPANPPAAVARRIGNGAAKRLVYTWPGGNMPQWSVNRLFEMVTRGEVEAALICGAEALATQRAAKRAGLALDWSEPADESPVHWGVEKRGWSDLEARHRMEGAIFAYPLFENALRGEASRSTDAHRRAMGELFAGFSAVAANNPLADRREPYTAEQIATVDERNPYIGFPYTRLMNANPYIDQSAALILTSVGKARALGIDEDRWVYLHGCADAHDHWHVTDRVNYHTSPAMRVVAREALTMADMDLAGIDRFDIYSCFPSAVRMACSAMGLALDDPRGLTVTGGLPYFGGPGNNYVTHSIAQMMVELRATPGQFGMVTANGNYVTKQSMGIYSTAEPPRAFAPRAPEQYQKEVDALPGPSLIECASGPATVETYTVMHQRGEPDFAIVIGRQADGQRFIANTPTDRGCLAEIVAAEFLGASGRVIQRDERNCFVPD